MSTHQTDYPVWPECTEHTNPEESDAHEFDCRGKSDCHAFTLADWHLLYRPDGQTWADPQHAWVHCEGCTARDAAMEEWKLTHSYGEGLGWEGVLCQVEDPELYCLECSDEQGQWQQHIDGEDDE